MHSFLGDNVSYHNTFRVIIALSALSHTCWDKNLPLFSEWVAARTWQPLYVGKLEERKFWGFLHIFQKALKLCISLRVSITQDLISAQTGTFKKENTGFWFACVFFFVLFL